MNSAFGNLKKENVEIVFNEISQHKSCTVKDIAQSTGLSIMTVGKVTDALVMLRLITRENSRTNSPGRRSSVYHHRTDRCAGIFSVSEKFVRFTVLDMNLSVKYDNEASLIIEMPAEEIIIKYTDCMRRELKNIIKRSTSIGEGVLVPCSYQADIDKLDVPLWNKLSAVSIDTAFFFGHDKEKIPVVDKRKAFINGIAGHFKDTEKVFVIFAGKSISTSHFRACDSEYNICDIGNLIFRNGKSFNEYISDITEPRLLCDIIAEYCVAIINTVKTDTICITGDRYRNMIALSDILREKILIKCTQIPINPPNIIYFDFHVKACEGIVSDIRKRWFSEEIQ